MAWLQSKFLYVIVLYRLTARLKITTNNNLGYSLIKRKQHTIKFFLYGGVTNGFFYVFSISPLFIEHC